MSDEDEGVQCPGATSLGLLLSGVEGMCCGCTA